jgi:hypothetical protein
MNNRKPAFLVMCAAESLRACLAFSAFLPLLLKDATRASLLAAGIAAPQLLIPLMWYYLWRDSGRNDALKGLILTGKFISAVADLAWIAMFVIGLVSAKSLIDAKIIGTASYWGIIIVMDLTLAAASFFLARGMKAEED